MKIWIISLNDFPVCAFIGSERKAVEKMDELREKSYMENVAFYADFLEYKRRNIWHYDYKPLYYSLKP